MRVLWSVRSILYGGARSGKSLGRVDTSETGLLRDNVSLVRNTPTGLGPAFGILREAIHQVLDPPAKVLQTVAIQIPRNVDLRAGNGPSPGERPWNGEPVPAVHSPRTIIPVSHHDQGQAKFRRQVD